MEKSITFKISRNDYIKCILSKILNKKVFFILYLFFYTTQVSNVIKSFSIIYLIVTLLLNFMFTIIFVFVYYFFMRAYGTYIYNRDPVLKSEVTINFREEVLEEITQYSKYTINYKEIYKLKFLKSMLLVYLSPARIIIIPKNTDYDIKELYAEVKKGMNPEKK